jgi:predicted flap endonuclease-1-like 5' DNA nuclease
MTDGTEAITTLHFALMAVLAALVVAAIIVGMRKKRLRRDAERQVLAHAQEAGVDVIVPEAAPRQVPVAPPPITDAPVPLARRADEPPRTSTHADAPSAPHPLADEPIAAAAAPGGTTAMLAADAEAPAAPSPADGPVTQLKGLGPKVASRLAELGIDRVGQIAALDDAGVAALDAQLGPFTGRIVRDRWVEQARLLASGDREGFERVFGRL